MDLDGPRNDKGMYTLVPLAPRTVIRNQDVVTWSSFRGKLWGDLRVAFMSQVSPDGRFVVDGAGNLQIIQSLLTDDGAPLYLFARPDGAIVFADSSFAAFLPVTDANHRPVKVDSQPCLVVPTGMSRIPGRFVRFIEQGKRFAFAKLA